jgi:PAS domain S-box-containing protein
MTSPSMSSDTPFAAPLSILHLEDSPIDAKLTSNLIQSEWPDCRITCVYKRADYQAAVEQGAFDLIISDYSLPGFDGLTALGLARAVWPDKPFIFLSGTIGEELAIEALKRGAIDYVIKDRPNRLIPAIRSAITRNAEIARRRRSEEALRQNQERFRQITENVADMIAVLDLEGRRTYVNPAYRDVLGDPEALRGTVSFNEIHPDDRDRIRALFADTVRTGRGRRSDYRFLLADGTVRYIESQSSVVRESDGRIINVLVVSRDMTDRLAIERRLRDQAALLDKARDAIIATDINHRITYWNPSAERLYGWTSDQAMGQSLPEMGLGYEAGRFKAARDQLFAVGEWRGNFTLQTKAGQTVQVESTWSLVLGDDGEPRSILVFDADITEKRKLETQLLQAQRVESIGTLTSGIAHDLNNVLAPILMGTGLLQLRLKDPADRSLVDTMSSSAHHGADLIQQLLTYARGAQGERSEVRLHTLLKEVDPLIRQSVRGNIHFSLTVDPDTKPVLADATQLKQVILNLCINARDAMPNGGRLSIRVGNVMVDGTWRRRLTDGRSGPHVCLNVADTGNGIPANLIEKIFDPFFTTKEIGKGTGLGLSTVHGIVKSHEGFLKVESDVGIGTTFSIYLPALLASPTPATTAPRSDSPRGSGETILVIDPDSAVRVVMASLLEFQGYRVIAAENGPAGLDLMRSQTGAIAAVIMSLVLPQMSGAELIAALNVINPAIRIIAMGSPGKAGGFSGHFDHRTVAAIVIKPVEPVQLLNTLRHVLDA